MHLPSLISDLALVLIVAGLSTIVFKKIKQPLVLGYIVAGFLVGPYFTALPTIVDAESIEIWSEIGIICLMFSLGLEFSFHKLANVGGTAIITSLTEVGGMFLLGFLGGRLLGWATIDSVILGGILSMSSTTIIIKAFDELNMKGKKFTELVFGALIVEDIVGIFLMVFMSTFALSSAGGGESLPFTIARLMFFLVLVLIAGIFLLPTLLRRAKKFMNDETLLVVALGICFGMVLLLSEIGFSTAMGAFLAGSILAGTVFSERVEHLIKPIKDLFGAVFFVSVGMLVDPSMLLRYAAPILVITLITIFGKLIFSSLGVLFSGQRLNIAIQCGTSLTQIGEFAFIIAGLGASLKLSSEFIYPVVVSVSVITTFTTPFFIKNADNIFGFVKKIMPTSLYEKLDNYTTDEDADKGKGQYWKAFLSRYLTTTIVRVVIIVAILMFGVYVVEPFASRFLSGTTAGVVTMVVVLSAMSPFLFTLLYSRDKNFSRLLMQSKTNRLPLSALMIIRVAISFIMVMITINTFLGIGIAWLTVPMMIFVVLISRSDWIVGHYMQVEARFLANFNEKVLLETAGSGEDGKPSHSWVSEQMYVGEYEITDGFEGDGISIKDIRLGRFTTIIKMISDKKHINIPDGSQKLRIGDILFFLGTEQETEMFEIVADKRVNGLKCLRESVSLRDFIVGDENGGDENQLFCYAVTAKRGRDAAAFAGKNLKTAETRKNFYANIIGIQRDNYPVVNPPAQFVINDGDQVWLLGGAQMIGSLTLAGLIETRGYEGEGA